MPSEYWNAALPDAELIVHIDTASRPEKRIGKSISSFIILLAYLKDCLSCSVATESADRFKSQFEKVTGVEIEMRVTAHPNIYQVSLY